MKEIPLTQGLAALVDDGDYGYLSRFKWYARRNGNTYYAARGVWRGFRWTTEYMHRVVLGLPDGVQVDHKNGDGLDNRRANLRLATHKENGRNRKPQGGTSRYKGVYWQKQAHAWRAEIRVDGRLIHLGLFDNEECAARAYDAAAQRYFGAFARTNSA